MDRIECKCGRKFYGLKDKEDTCPECLLLDINPPKSVHIEFCEANEKFDLVIEGIYVGKYYTFTECIKGIGRGTTVARAYKDKENSLKEEAKTL